MAPLTSLFRYGSVVYQILLPLPFAFLADTNETLWGHGRHSPSKVDMSRSFGKLEWRYEEY